MHPLQQRSPSLGSLSPHDSPNAALAMSALSLATPKGSSPLTLSPLTPPRPLAPRRPSFVALTDALGLGGLPPAAPRSSISGQTQRPLSPPPRVPATLSPSRSPMTSRSHSPIHSASPQPKPLTAPCNDDPGWRDGDFELVSSDNVRFRVASYHILSASSVLRTAAEFDPDTQRYHIHFSDDELESALVIRSFLRTITTGKVATTPDGSGTPSVAALRRLILFAKKYDCSVTLQLILFKIKELLSSGISVPMYSFILGATADDVDTCCLALRHMEETWTNANAGANGTGSPNGATGYDVRNEGTPGAPTIDPNNLPYTLWQWIPQGYMWALSRAWGRHIKDGTRLPEEFQRVITIVKSIKETHGRQPSVSLV